MEMPQSTSQLSSLIAFNKCKLIVVHLVEKLKQFLVNVLKNNKNKIARVCRNENVGRQKSGFLFAKCNRFATV